MQPGDAQDAAICKMGGNCSTGRCGEASGGGMRAVEPLDEAPIVAESDAYAFPAEIRLNDPAPITVDLHKPDVDVDAPLDDRDIELVQQTFARVALLGTANVGWVLFMNIFKLAPGAKSLFKFNDAEDVAMSSKMKSHAGKVVETVATAIAMLYNLDELVPVLKELGELHVGFSVVPAHYDVVGEAFIAALTSALGPKMTPAVTNAYLKVYTLVKNTMIGDHYQETSAPEEVHPPQEDEATAEAKLEEARRAKEAEDLRRKEEEAKKKKDAAEKKKAAQKEEKRRSERERAKKEKEEQAKKKAEADQKKAEEEEAIKQAAVEAKAQRLDAWKAMDKKEQGKLIDKLMKAAKDGNTANAKAVLEANCLPDAEDKDGQTALHYAADKGKTEVVKLLLEWGASPTAKVKLGEWGLCALHYAARQGHSEIAALVYDAKAMGNNNCLKKTPIDIAKEKGHDDIASALKKLHSAHKKK